MERMTFEDHEEDSGQDPFNIEKHPENLLESDIEMGNGHDQPPKDVPEQISEKFRINRIYEDESRIEEIREQLADIVEQRTSSQPEVLSNVEVLSLAKEIIDGNYDLENATSAEARELLSKLRFDRFSASQMESVPEEVLEAEAKIYSKYEPSNVLSDIHDKAVTEALDGINNTQLFENQKIWSEASPQEKLIMCDELVKKLALSYDLPFEMKSGMGYSERSNIAYFFYTQVPQRMGYVAFSDKLLKADYETVFDHIAHEMSHAFQEALMQGFVKKEGLEEDFEWFKASKRMNTYRDVDEYRRDSTFRYKSLPIEKDAFSMQDRAGENIRKRIEDVQNIILSEHGLPALKDIKKESRMALVIQEVIGNGESNWSADEIIEQVSNLYGPRASGNIEKAIKDMSLLEIQQFIIKARETSQQASKALGVEVK